MRKISQFTVWVLITQLLFSALLVFPSSSANPLTEVTLDLQEESPTVDVSPDSSGIVTVHGTVTCEKWGPDLVQVFLSGNSTFGPAPVVPASFVFSGSAGSVNVETFSVTTRVPMGTSSSEEVFVTVTGYFDQGGIRNSIEPVSIKIIVLQYYSIAVEDEGGRIENINASAKAGSDAHIQFNLANWGNGNDVFEIDFINRDEMQDRGFTLPIPNRVSLKEDQKEEMKIPIGIPEGIKGERLLEISITSEGSEESGSSEQLILPINLKITEENMGEIIGSIFLSPITIFAIVAVISAVIIYKKRS